jgi:hypothetical protein
MRQPHTSPSTSLGTTAVVPNAATNRIRYPAMIE